MVTVQNPSYSLVLALQLVFLGADLICNAFSLLLSRNQIVLLILYATQDALLVVALVLLLLVFFNTLVFRAGLILLLLREFYVALLTWFIYLALTVVYHGWSLAVRWNSTNQYNWTGVLQTVYALQKLCALLYYFVFKRALMTLGNSRYYEDSPWLKKRLQ